MRLLLDHSIVGISATSLTVRKDREFAACRICGMFFQPENNTNKVADEDYLANPTLRMKAHEEIKQWRQAHNKTHTGKEHMQLAKSGRTLTALATNRLAPFGIVPLADAEEFEIRDALRLAPRAPVDDVQSSLKGYVPISVKPETLFSRITNVPKH